MASREQPTEEELRAAYEAEMKRIRVDDLVLESVVNMVNLGMRRTGLVPGTEDERDPAQVQTAIEAVRALVPLLEASAPAQMAPLRQALSQLQLAYVQIAGGAGAAGAAGAGGAGAAGAAGAGATRAGAGAAGDAAPGGAEGGAGPAGAGQPGQGAGAGQAGGGAGQPGGGEPGDPVIKPGEPGPAQRSGRLWVPGSR